MQGQPTCLTLTFKHSNIMNYKTNGFSTNNGIYPTVLITDDLMDCQPNGENRSYTYIDHSDDEDWLDEHDDNGAEYQIPDRAAFYQLMDDICMAIHNNIDGYEPGDDTTCDVQNAIYLLNDMRSFDLL